MIGATVRVSRKSITIISGSGSEVSQTNIRDERKALPNAVPSRETFEPAETERANLEMCA
jgi:hypothetical protein